MAGRSIPMMGIDRSKLPRRAFLFLFVLFAMPLAVRSATLEDSAKELARKIAGSLSKPGLTGLPPQDDVSVEIQNTSSLMSEEVSLIDRTLKMELLKYGIVTPQNTVIHARVTVTLSENFKDYVFTAEIRQGDATRVVLATSPRLPQGRIVSNTMRMTLHSEKFWEQPERIIDVTFVFLSNYEQRMVVLTRDGLIITKAEAGAASQNVGFPPAEIADREPTGRLLQDGPSVHVWLGERSCPVDLETVKLIRCFVPTRHDPDSTGIVEGLEKPKYGDQVKRLLPTCGISDADLAAGMGDYTQPDWVQVFDGNKAISNQLFFPGPVLEFSQGPDTQFTTAIVHNLKDGNYELYRLSISCGQ
jgi:hypothetical protein